MPWRLVRLQQNPDHKKFSSLYNTVVVTFFPYRYSFRRAQTWEASPLKNPIEPPQSNGRDFSYKYWTPETEIDHRPTTTSSGHRVRWRRCNKIWKEYPKER